MRYRQIVILITALWVAFGIFALGKMNKNEFPDFTVRQGVVAAVYPGASVTDMEQQVTKPLENYIFTYKEVKKANTRSFTRNGLTIIQVELNDDINASEMQDFWSRFKLDGEYEQANEANPQIVGGLLISVVVIFFLMLAHFRRISTALLLLASLSLIALGTAMGVLLPGSEFSLTCYLGVISLMGILIRNAIIMFDYAEELRETEHLTAHEAILLSAKRRMRPIFLTSAAASMGVIPMMLGGSGLWAPMGNVIFFGTMITMLFILTVLPISYWLVMSGSTARRLRRRAFENQ